MDLIEQLVRNPVKTAVGVILVSLFGVIAMFRMPMQLTPEVQTPTITIETRWPGASPQEVEREIVQEQEEQLKSVEGIVKLSSESMDSMGRITLEFSVGEDMQQALVKVNSRLQQVPEYPEDADEPVIQTANAADRPIAWFILGPRLPDTGDFEKYIAAHPTPAWLGEDLRAIRNDPNAGLRVLKIRELAARAEQLREILPDDRAAQTVSKEALADFAANHPRVREDLEAALQASDWRAALVPLRELAANDPDIRQLLPTAGDLEKLRRFAEDYIESRLERVDGVSNSNVFGGRDPELQVVVDPQKLAQRQITVIDVRNTLRGQNSDISAGDFWEGKRRYVVRTLGQFRDIEQVESQILAIRNGAPVYVKDVAEVRLGYKKPDGMVRRYGIACIAVNCLRETGANVLDVMEGLKKATEELNKNVLKDRGLELNQVYDETEYIYSALGLVVDNLVAGSVLTIISLLLILRSVKSTVVITITIPTSVIGAFLLLNILGRSLNVISLGGMAFAVGMVVDNAIVVLENIYRHYQLGASPFDATVRGTNEVWGAIIASTCTTLAVFLPVVLIKEEAGQLFLDISLAISFSVGLSLIIAVTLVPVATNLLFDEQMADDTLQAANETMWGRFLNTILAPFDWIGAKMVSWVAGLNHAILPSIPLRLAAVLITVLGSTALTWLFWPKVEYLPNGNRNLVFGIVLPPAGYNLDKLMQLGTQVENDLRPYWDFDPEKVDELKYPAVQDFFYVARGRQVFVGVRALEPSKAAGLVPLIRDVGSRLSGTITVAMQSSLFAQGLVAGRAIDIEITGPELPKLVGLGGEIMGMVMNPDPQTAILPNAQARPIPSLDLSNPEVHIHSKLHQSAESRIPNADLGYTVNALIDGAYASDYYLDGKKIDLVVMGKESAIQHSQDLEFLPVTTPDGTLVTLGAIAEIEPSSGPEQINRRERERAITIQVTPPDNIALQDAIERIQSGIVEKLETSGRLDGGYRISLAGTSDKLRNTWSALGGNIALACVITYLLMAALFESWLYPFVIILTVPLGAVGGVLGLYFLNIYLGWIGEPLQALDVLTMLGFVILIGTVVSNPILIVHQSLAYIVEEGMTPSEAIVETVMTRMRPIFLTSIGTVIGLFPLVMFPGPGAELYRGLGAVVLGGIFISTGLTLIVVPALFSLSLDVLVAAGLTTLPSKELPRSQDDMDEDMPVRTVVLVPK